MIQPCSAAEGRSCMEVLCAALYLVFPSSLFRRQSCLDSFWLYQPQKRKPEQLGAGGGGLGMSVKRTIICRDCIRLHQKGILTKLGQFFSCRLPPWSKFMTLVLSQADIFSIKAASLTKKRIHIRKGRLGLVTAP